MVFLTSLDHTILKLFVSNAIRERGFYIMKKFKYT